VFTRSICPTRMNESKYLKAGLFAQVLRPNFPEVLLLEIRVAQGRGSTYPVRPGLFSLSYCCG